MTWNQFMYKIGRDQRARACSTYNIQLFSISTISDALEFIPNIRKRFQCTTGQHRRAKVNKKWASEFVSICHFETGKKNNYSPKCPPNVEAHGVQPKECRQKEELRRDRCKEKKEEESIVEYVHLFVSAVEWIVSIDFGKTEQNTHLNIIVAEMQRAKAMWNWWPANVASERENRTD